MKLLWVIALLLAVIWLLRGQRRGPPVGRRPEAAPPKPTRPAPSTAVRPMVRCAHCGVHLAQDEALSARGQYYCDAAHRDAGPERR